MTNRPFFLVRTVGSPHPHTCPSAVVVRPMRSGLVPFGGNRLRVAVSPFTSDVFTPPWSGPIGREAEDAELPAGGKCGTK